LGQMLGTMAEIVLDMIALAFEDIDSLILNLPTGTAKVTNIRHVAGREGVVGDPTIVIQAFTGGFMGDLQITPIDQQGLVTAPDGHLINPWPAPNRAMPAVPAPL